MKKLFFQYVCWVFILIMLLSCVAGCAEQGPGNDATDEGTQPPPSVEDPTSVSDFTVEMLSKMKIVYAHGTTEDISAKADELKTLIRNIYGVEIIVTSDYLRAGSEIYCEIPNEILIGETNRSADDEYYAEIRYEDYGYTTVGGKIIIGGGNTQATLKAVSDFAYNIITLKKGGDELFFSPDLAKAYAFNYTASEILLNDVSCREYRIVYPANGTQFEEQLAIHIASNIESFTGYRLDIVSDRTNNADGYEILVGKTNRGDALYATATGGSEGCIASDGKYIAVYGASAQGNAIAATALIDRMEAAISKEDKKADLKLSSAEVIRETETVSTMTYNVYAGDVTSERADRVLELMLRYLPDVIGVQEASAAWMSVFPKNLSEYYDIVGEGQNGGTMGSYCAILYSKARFELLETETKWLSNTPDKVSKFSDSNWVRIMTYALLKDRITGETVCFVNTHLDFAEARYRQAKILFELLRQCGVEDYPVLVMGDMNCNSASREIKHMMSLGFGSANTLADFADGIPDIDFIMVTKDCFDVSYARVCNESVQGEVPSDHPATYAEFTVVIPEEGIDHDFREPLPNLPEGWLELERNDEDDAFGELNRVPPKAPPEEENGSDTDEPLPDSPEGWLEVEENDEDTEFGELNRVH